MTTAFSDKITSSSPVPGGDTTVGVTVLGSGSSGNALVVHGPSGALLIDAGFSGIEVRRRLAATGVDESLIRCILVSHEHTDHARGVGILSRRWGVPVYCNRLTGDAMRYKDAKLDGLHLFASGHVFEVGDFHIQPFSIPHDASEPVGFAIRCANRKVAVATDLGHASQLVKHHLRDSDILVVESNHDIGMVRDSERPWNLKQRILSRHGHLSNEASLELIAGVLSPQTRHVVLAHASQECNRYELVEAGVVRFLAEWDLPHLNVQVARQNDALKTLWV